MLPSLWLMNSHIALINNKHFTNACYATFSYFLGFCFSICYTNREEKYAKKQPREMDLLHY